MATFIEELAKRGASVLPGIDWARIKSITGLSRKDAVIPGKDPNSTFIRGTEDADVSANFLFPAYIRAKYIIDHLDIQIEDVDVLGDVAHDKVRGKIKINTAVIKSALAVGIGSNLAEPAEFDVDTFKAFIKNVWLHARDSMQLFATGLYLKVIPQNDIADTADMLCRLFNFIETLDKNKVLDGIKKKDPSKAAAFPVIGILIIAVAAVLVIAVLAYATIATTEIALINVRAWDYCKDMSKKGMQITGCSAPKAQYAKVPGEITRGSLTPIVAVASIGLAVYAGILFWPEINRALKAARKA